MSQPEAPRAPRPAIKLEENRDVIEILVPSLKVGLGTGAAGLFVGAAGGIVRSSVPILFSLVTGAQWFALGTSYTATRKLAMRSLGGEDKVSPGNKVAVSGLAGSTAGLVGGALRGPRNIIPALAVFSLLGAGGQAVVNSMPTETKAAASEQVGWMASKWSPVKPLSDDEYAKFIQEKILRLEVEMSMVDEQIAALEASKAQKAAAKRASTE